jgi:hypoxanthine-guanine phosphoribosyltransferase
MTVDGVILRGYQLNSFKGGSSSRITTRISQQWCSSMKTQEVIIIEVQLDLGLRLQYF